MRGWISKHEAITLVVFAQADRTLGSRSSAGSTLRQWVLKGLVRTRPAKERPHWCKRMPRLYRRADILAKIDSCKYMSAIGARRFGITPT